MSSSIPAKHKTLLGPRRCASRGSTNQNASFVEWFSCLERVVFRGIRGEIFALFQACVGNFDTIPPWKVVGTLYLDSSCVTFKYSAFLSVCDTFELLGHVQAAMMIWVFFLPFFLDSLLVTVIGFIELFWPACYFNLSSLQILGSTRVYPGLPLLVFPLWAVEGVLELRHRLTQVAQLPGNGAEKTCRSRSRREASNAKSRKSWFYFKPQKVNKFEYCNNLWKQNIFHNPRQKLKASL